MEKWKSWGNVLEMSPDEVAAHIINDNLSHEELRSFIQHLIDNVASTQRVLTRAEDAHLTLDNDTAYKILTAEMVDHRDVFERLKNR